MKLNCFKIFKEWVLTRVLCNDPDNQESKYTEMYGYVPLLDNDPLDNSIYENND